MLFEICLFCVIVAYNIFIWTLREREKTKKGKLPPGPWGIPVFGYIPFLGKLPALTFAKLSHKYGSMVSVRLGQTDVVFINDWDTAKEIGRIDAFQGRNQCEIFKPRGYAGLGLLEGKHWQQMRRFTLKCLRDMGFGKRSMEGLMQQQVHNTRDYLKRNCREPLYIKPVLELAVINSIWSMMTSETYDLEDPSKRHVMSVMSKGIGEQNIVGIAAFLPWLAKLFPNWTGYNEGLEYLGAPESLAWDVIQSHIANYDVNNERDLIDKTLTKIYSTTDQSSVFFGKWGLQNLHYTLLDLFFAGSDTMSSTLGWSFVYLAQYPNIQRKVQDEIDQVIGQFRMPSLDDLDSMPYTQATMQELLRKTSVLPLGLMHAAIEDVHFQKYFFPKGTVLLYNLWYIHHDSRYWGDPDTFRPERFITDAGTFRKDDHVIAFGTGKRACIAESLGRDEYFLFFTGILQQFQFSLNPNEKLPYLGPRAEFILPPPKHNLIIAERDSNFGSDIVIVNK